VRRRLRRVPLPLACLVAAATILACAWTVLMPPLQNPDEVTHFAYVQRIAEQHVIPWNPSGNAPPGLAYSDELSLALGVGGFGPLSVNIAARPLWTRADERFWTRASAAADRGNGGYAPSMRNPPLYYLYELVPYGLGRGGTFWDRSILMRLANVPLLITALVFIWLLAGELLGRGLLQYVATAVAALIPELMNMVAAINPDIALVAEWSAALYLMTLVVRRGPRLRFLVLLVAVLFASGLTQPRGLPLVVPALIALLLGLARERGWRRVNPLTLGVGAVVIGVPLVLGLAGRGPGNVREFGSYVWQFYLPKLGFMNTTIGPVTYDVRSGFVDRIFGGLAQLEVVLPATIEDVAWWVACLGLVALLVALVIRRDSLRRNAGLAVVFVTAIWTSLLTLHLVAYRAMLSNPHDPIITGRYLLPLVGLLALAVAIVGSVLPRTLRAAYSGLVLAAGVAIQIVSLGLLVERFYA
jgi:hypothetical protein